MQKTMKRLVSLVLSVMLLFTLLPRLDLTASATQETVSEEASETAPAETLSQEVSATSLWEYTAYGSGVELTAYNGTATDIYVPAEVDGNTVLKLGDSLFEDNDAVNSVTLAEGITEIGVRTFYDADQLVCIVTNQTLTTIGTEAFYSCDSFNSVILYDAVTAIGDSAFAECPSLTVWCNENSYAHTYVVAQSIPYEILNPDITPETYIQDGVTYYISNGQAKAIAFDGSVTDVTIPSTVEDYPVYELYYTFQNATTLVSVTLPENLKIISAKAFEGCTALQSVNIPQSVTSIGHYAFSGCTALEETTIPEGIENLPSGFFNNCTRLTSVILPSTLKSTETYVFSGCTALKQVVLPEGITTLGGYLFQNCKALESVTIPDSATTLGDCLFYGCTGLNEVIWPSGMTVIPMSTFRGCTALTSVVIPDSVTTIDSGAFYGCSKLASVTLPEGLESIGIRSFYECASLAEIVIPQSVTTLGHYAFYGCATLESIELPHGITRVENYTFYGCEKLSNVHLPDGITAIGEYAFYGCTGLAEIEIPDAVTYIGKYAFYECSSLRKVAIPDGVTTIYEYTFCDCRALTEVELPSNLRTIESHGFRYCGKLYLLELPTTLTSIASTAFSNTDIVGCLVYEGSCGLTYAQSKELLYFVVDGTSVPETYIQDGISYYLYNSEAVAYDCDDTLTEVVIPDTVQDHSVTQLYMTFNGCSGLESVVLPNTLEVIGRQSFQGCKGISSIVLPDNVTQIDEYGFASCVNLEKIVFPENFDKIGAYAFYNCQKLNDVTMPKTMNSLGDRAFSCCYSLTKISIPEGITTLPGLVFNYSNKLNQVTLPSTLTSVSAALSGIVLVVQENTYAHTFAIEKGYTYVLWDGVNEPEMYAIDGVIYKIEDDEAVAIGSDKTLTSAEIPATVEGYPVTELRKTFYGCSSLVSVALPEGLEVIGASAFMSCSKLTSITIPQSVTTIGKSAFSGCTKLSQVVLPDSLTSIPEYLFYNCTLLRSVNIPDGVVSIGANAFYYCKMLRGSTLPSQLQVIGDYAFYYCQYFSPSSMPSSVTYIGERAFSYCKGLSALELPDGLKTIGREAFARSSIRSVTIPASVTYIGMNAFYYSSLTSVTLCDGLTTLSQGIFEYCSGITKIVIPGSIKTVSYQAFQYCYGLIEVVVEDGVEYIDGSAFYQCSHLQKVTLADSVIGIGYRTFENCSSLCDVICSENLTEIDDCAFLNCVSLGTAVIPGGASVVNYQAFYKCANLKKITIEEGVHTIDAFAFAGSGLTTVELPSTLTNIRYNAFSDCTKLTSVVLEEGVTTIEENAFNGCSSLRTVLIPESVTSLQKTTFPVNTILIVYENSYAHTFAVENNLLYFVIQKTENPEIHYGTGISGTVTYTDDTAASGATVEILYDDGTLKESVTTDENGAYEFTYAEVGRYTIRVTDANGNTAAQTVSVKRMNAFDVFLAGDTDLTLKKAWTVSGTVSPAGAATVTLTDETGNLLASAQTADGSFTLTNVPNGTYILTAETASGKVSQEVTVFDGSVSDILLQIAAETAAIWGYVEVEDRAYNHHRRNWVEVTVYNSEGIAVGKTRSDGDGKYEFTNLPLGEYTIVARTAEMRPDHKGKGYDRSYTLTGYAYVDAQEATTYQAEDIVLYEENDCQATISGKVTAQGESQACEVILRNVFRHEVAKYDTGKNGKYTFKNIPDGLYIITAVTESSGMGFAVVAVRNGKVHGETDISVYKTDKIKNREDRFHAELDDCRDRDGARSRRARIAEEKRFYDGLSEKEKKQLSKEYVRRLNELVEWAAACEYETGEGVTVREGGMTISGAELEEERTVTFTIDVTKRDKWETSTDGVNTREDFIQHEMEDRAGDREISAYYEITMTKTVDGQEQAITSVYKDTETTGKFRITLQIPEEHRGYKHYSFIHVHHGEPVELVDLDNDPNTVTFEVDRFSTFALVGTDEDKVEIPAAADSTGEKTYASLEAAIADAAAGSMVVLCKDVTENVTVSKELCLDLNGFDINGTVTVADGAALYCLDSQTDDYTVEDSNGYGKVLAFACEGTGTVAGLPEESDLAADGYLMVTETEGVSFHRVDLQITAMSLRAQSVGVYYTSSFAADEIAANCVRKFGIALSVAEEPNADNMDSFCEYSAYTAYAAGANPATGTLLRNIMQTTNTDETNQRNAAMPVYGRAYIETEDGYMFGACVVRSLQQQLEEIDKIWTGLTQTQQLSVLEMYGQYISVMQSWDIPAIRSAYADYTA